LVNKINESRRKLLIWTGIPLGMWIILKLDNWWGILPLSIGIIAIYWKEVKKLWGIKW